MRELIDNEIIKNKNDIKGLTFISLVKGTGPNYQDFFRSSVHFLDGNDQEIKTVEFEETKEGSRCKENGNATVIKFEIKLEPEMTDKIERI